MHLFTHSSDPMKTGLDNPLEWQIHERMDGIPGVTSFFGSDYCSITAKWQRKLPSILDGLPVIPPAIWEGQGIRLLAAPMMSCLPYHTNKTWYVCIIQFPMYTVLASHTKQGFDDGLAWDIRMYIFIHMYPCTLLGLSSVDVSYVRTYVCSHIHTILERFSHKTLAGPDKYYPI